MPSKGKKREKKGGGDSAEDRDKITDKAKEAIAGDEEKRFLWGKVGLGERIWR